MAKQMKESAGTNGNSEKVNTIQRIHKKYEHSKIHNLSFKVILTC